MVDHDDPHLTTIISASIVPGAFSRVTPVAQGQAAPGADLGLVPHRKRHHHTGRNQRPFPGMDRYIRPDRSARGPSALLVI